MPDEKDVKRTGPAQPQVGVAGVEVDPAHQDRPEEGPDAEDVTALRRSIQGNDVEATISAYDRNRKR